MTILDDIIATKRAEIERLGTLEQLEQQVSNNTRVDIRIPIWSENLDVIAEIKRKSPSKGELADVKDPGALAKSYEDGGATAISVLTDSQYFGARHNDLVTARNAVTIPVLRKDFIVDPRQVYETYLMGADMMLLIVAAFTDDDVMKDIYDRAVFIGLKVLVEAHSLEEIRRAAALTPEIIGINVRDLSTFDEDHTLGSTLISCIPEGVHSVWESSIRSLDDAQLARDSHADAVLVGQGLVQHQNPQDFVMQMRNIS